MMNPYLIIGALLGVFLAFSTGAWTGYEFASGRHAKALVAEQVAADKLRTHNKELSDKVAFATARDILQLRARSTAINKEIRHERDKSPSLNAVDCAAPVSTVRVLNAARGYEDARPSADGTAPAVPTTGTAGRDETAAVR